MNHSLITKYFKLSQVHFVDDSDKEDELKRVRKNAAFAGLRNRTKEIQEQFEKEQAEYREAQKRASNAGKVLFTLAQMSDGHPRGF